MHVYFTFSQYFQKMFIIDLSRFTIFK